MTARQRIATLYPPVQITITSRRHGNILSRASSSTACQKIRHTRTWDGDHTGHLTLGDGVPEHRRRILDRAWH